MEESKLTFDFCRYCTRAVQDVLMTMFQEVHCDRLPHMRNEVNTKRVANSESLHLTLLDTYDCILLITYSKENSLCHSIRNQAPRIQFSSQSFTERD